MPAPTPEPDSTEPGRIGPDSIVRLVMDAHPETVAVFLRHRMHCPGCVMSPFMTLAEAAANYDMDAAELVAELRAVIPFADSRERR